MITSLYLAQVSPLSFLILKLSEECWLDLEHPLVMMALMIMTLFTVIVPWRNVSPETSFTVK